jgi:hypothetical protein
MVIFEPSLAVFWQVAWPGTFELVAGQGKDPPTGPVVNQST